MSKLSQSVPVVFGPFILCLCVSPAVFGSESGVSPVAPRIDQIFGNTQAEGVGGADAVPDFRRHVIPLIGRLGCNGRACHGSFQGQGGFRLSLFGYDFKADHENLFGGDEPRTNLRAPLESLILQKPLEEVPHDGGRRLEADSWQHRVLEQWIRGGGKGVDKNSAEFVALEVSPNEIVASRAGETWQLSAVAVWSDGSREDVTPLCRFQSNNDQIAVIDEFGLVTAKGPGDTHVVAFYDNGVVPVPVLFPVSNQWGPQYPDVPIPTTIDELVVAKLRKLGEVPSDLCTDSEFLRRVSLDIAGTLPTSTETLDFLADKSSDKRSRKIDELLARPGHAAWWATRFCDWTGNNANTNQNNGPDRRNTVSELWYQWMRARIAENLPYDELVERIVLARSRLDGESYEDYCVRMSSYLAKGHEGEFADQPYLPYYWSRSNFRTTEERALGFAYAFLGVRIQCAQCHKHPFDQWTKDDFDRFENFFGRVRFVQARQVPDAKAEIAEMMTALDLDAGLTGNRLDQQLYQLASRGKVVPFGETVVMPPPKPVDPAAIARMQEREMNPKKKEKLAQFLSGRTATVLGGEEFRLDEVDDPRSVLMNWMLSEDNPYFARAIVNRVWSCYFNVGIVEPPDDLSLANPASNEQLLDYLAAEFRKNNYDLKWLHREICNSRTYQVSWRPNATNMADDRNFARAVPRRIPAEVVYDAIKIATAGEKETTSLCALETKRAITDPIVTARNTNYALTVFGRSIRETNCDCDRSMEPSLLQTVFLQNDAEMLSMIDRPTGWVAEVTKSTSGVVDTIDGGTGRQKELQASLDRAYEKLARARAEKSEKTVAKAESIIASIQSKIAALSSKENSHAVAGTSIDSQTRESLIRDAYLRTLTREPDEAELHRAAAAFNGASPREATRDLMWALLNTKEFVLNH